MGTDTILVDVLTAAYLTGKNIAVKNITTTEDGRKLYAFDDTASVQSHLKRYTTDAIMRDIRIGYERLNEYETMQTNALFGTAEKPSTEINSNIADVFNILETSSFRVSAVKKNNHGDLF